MCIVHGSQMQMRLCELWRRKEVGTEWAAGSLDRWPLFATPVLDLLYLIVYIMVLC